MNNKDIERRIALLEEELMAEDNKKRKKSNSNGTFITITTGDIDKNIKHFNKLMGTDTAPLSGTVVAQSCTQADTLSGSASESTSDCASDCAGDCGGEGLGEELNEAKRNVRRYYIRPQNIFCANKSDVIKALIEIGENNCSVYTLKNLGDVKDPQKLTTKDIIYYYDEGILYDKNHVKVMDYDLYIKHEEERKKFSGDIDKVPETAFKDEYEDRITDKTFEEGLHTMKEAISIKDLKQQFDNHNADDPIGYSFEENEHRVFSDGEPYGGTNWYADYIPYENTYHLYYEEVSKYGDSDGPVEYGDYDTFEDLMAAIAQLNLEDCVFDLDDYLEEEAFFLDYKPVNVYGELVEARNNTKTCCICGEPFEGYGNNAAPYAEGRCCDACNIKFVIPARIDLLNQDTEENN